MYLPTRHRPDTSYFKGTRSFRFVVLPLLTLGAMALLAGWGALTLVLARDFGPVACAGVYLGIWPAIGVFALGVRHARRRQEARGPRA